MIFVAGRKRSRCSSSPLACSPLRRRASGPLSRGHAWRLIPLLVFALFPAGLWAQGLADSVFLFGLWEGSVDLGQGPEPLAIRLFPADPEAGQGEGGLLDLPARSLYGYPMGQVERDPRALVFTLLGNAPFAGRFSLEAAPAEAAEAPEPAGERAAPVSGSPFSAAPISGAAALSPAEGAAATMGSFSLDYAGTSVRGRAYGVGYDIDTGRGILPGSLVLPEAPDGPLPLVLMIPGAAQDRDGDNYAVPGKSDALLQLALALRDKNIASFRYDRRGAGEAYRLGEREAELRFGDHVADARAAIGRIARDPRFSGIWILGYGEGALVGAAALIPGAPQAPPEAVPEAPSLAPEASGKVQGLAALCASGKTELETVEEALASIPDEQKAEAGAIMEALKSGLSYPDPSPYFADFFRPSVQGYLASYFRCDIRSIFAALDRPVLIAAGGSDLQVGAAEAALLASFCPRAALRSVAGMSHALKEVGADEDANYASFTDPSIRLSEGLVELLSAFIRGEGLPGEDPREASPPNP